MIIASVNGLEQEEIAESILKEKRLEKRQLNEYDSRANQSRPISRNLTYAHAKWLTMNVFFHTVDVDQNRMDISIFPSEFTIYLKYLKSVGSSTKNSVKLRCLPSSGRIISNPLTSVKFSILSRLCNEDNVCCPIHLITLGFGLRMH